MKYAKGIFGYYLKPAFDKTKIFFYGLALAFVLSLLFDVLFR